MGRAGQESRAFWRHPRFADLSLLAARFTRHRYALHTHPTYVVALVTEGAERLRVGRQRILAPAGSLILVNPEEPHDGEAGVEAGWAYRTCYPTLALMQSVAEEIGLPRPPLFAAPLVADEEVARAFAGAHWAAAGSDALEAETAMLLALRLLLRRHANGVMPGDVPAAGGARGRVALYREAIEASLTEEPALAVLAALAGVTRFQVIRDFRRELGLAPGAYLRGRRLHRAATLMARGEPLAQVAQEAGFADQSHLTRAFVAAHGVTPGAWRRAMRQN